MSTVSQHSSQNLPTEFSDMSAVQAFSRALVRREQARSGGCSETAIARVASRIKTGPGTLGNIIRNRVKSVCFNLGQRIIAAAISDIENERKQLEHEREILMSVVAPASPADLAEVEAALEAARQGLARMRARQ